VEADEEKCRQYIELIKDINKDQLVYIDESGIETNSVKDRGWGKKKPSFTWKEEWQILRANKYYRWIC